MPWNALRTAALTELAQHLSPTVPGQDDAIGETRALLGLVADFASRDAPAGKLVVSAMILDGADNVLLTWHRVFRQWQQLGGHLEPGDASLSAAALREATEESGLTDLTLTPGVLDIALHGPARRRVFDVRFLFRTPRILPPVLGADAEILSWFTPQDLPEAVDASALRAVTSARGLLGHACR